jgi:Tol biopolymer transport system component
LRSEGKEKARQITNIPGGACQPAWSPDGQWLVFTVPCDTNQALYRGSGLWRIKADDDLDNPTTLEQLSSDILGGDFDPAWSPDGSKIIFTSLRDGGRARIYSLDLTSKVNPEDSYLVERLSLRTSYDLQPAWSTDGQKIAFVSTQKGPVQVWTMDSNGGNQTMFSRSGNRINSHPQWSINGERILFTQVDELGKIPKLVVASYIKESEDSDDQGIYDEVPYDLRYDLGLMPAREAKYSPNGGYLAFESWPEGQNHDIYIMAVSGGDLNRLTTWERFDFDAAWRPAVVRQE